MLWKRLACVAFCLLVASTAEAKKVELPSARFYADISKKVNGPIETVWDAALQVVDKEEGILLVAERSSGLIVYRITDVAVGEAEVPVFVNVLLIESVKGDGTMVYVMPHRASGELFTGPEVSFFQWLERELRNQR